MQTMVRVRVHGVERWVTPDQKRQLQQQGLVPPDQGYNRGPAQDRYYAPVRRNCQTRRG